MIVPVYCWSSNILKVRFLGHPVCSMNIVDWQDWCNTANGKWGNCKSKCKGGVPGCFKANVKYSPLDFLGVRGSVEMSAEACKARCEAHPKCSFFSFWEKELPKDNGCTLFGSNAKFGGVAQTFDDVTKTWTKTWEHVTGPPSCPGDTFLPTSSVESLPS